MILGLLSLLLLLALLFGLAPPMMEEMAATSTAVKLGSAVMAAVAALTLSASDGCCVGCNGGLEACEDPTS